MKKLLALTEDLIGTFTYVDCGARGDSSKGISSIFSHAHHIGFDPDEEECRKLSMSAKPGHSFFPVAVGKQDEVLDFFVTKNPGCSSLYRPNHSLFTSFMECGPFFEVVSTSKVQIVALDDYFPQNGITDIDFLELDTQGSELDILRGSQHFLKRSVVAVKVEVEFAEMYQNQPMFGDVDSWLRLHGFMLFDLERYHLRRKDCPPDVDSREQIVWGQALYLRDFRSFPGDSALMKQKLGKLAMVASYHGFHSYALEVVNYLTQQTDLLTSSEKHDLEKLIVQYISDLRKNRTIAWMRFLEKSFLRKAFRRWGIAFADLCQSFQFVTRKNKYFWKD